MALITCKECKKEFSNKVKKCPHCGIKNKKYTHPIIKFIGWAFLGLVGLAILSAIISPSSHVPSREATDALREFSKPKAAKPLPEHGILSRSNLAPRDGYRVQIKTSNAELTKAECRQLINHYRSQAGNEGQVSVHKPDTRFPNDPSLSPWCVDNIDGRGIRFNY